MKAHDTQGFIEEVAKIALRRYKRLKASDKAWFAYDHFAQLNSCVHESSEAEWFFSQRGSYQSTLR